MARYYFNTFDGDALSHEDDVGEALPTREAAWEMATHFAAEGLRDLDGKLRSDRDRESPFMKAECGKTARSVCAADGGKPFSGRLLRPDRRNEFR
jgi:Domain of unknown function (DUF6894)